MNTPKRYTLRLPEISYGTEENTSGEFVRYADYAALQAEVERLKSMLSMSQAIAEACGEPQGDGAITVKAATSTGKTVLTDIAAKEGGRK